MLFINALHQRNCYVMDRACHRYSPLCRCTHATCRHCLVHFSAALAHTITPDTLRRRYLPDIYKFVTHEKGILGSQVSLLATPLLLRLVLPQGFSGLAACTIPWY